LSRLSFHDAKAAAAGAAFEKKEKKFESNGDVQR
jgi:hypothetical protein